MNFNISLVICEFIVKDSFDFWHSVFWELYQDCIFYLWYFLKLTSLNYFLDLFHKKRYYCSYQSREVSYTMSSNLLIPEKLFLLLIQRSWRPVAAHIKILIFLTITFILYDNYDILYLLTILFSKCNIILIFSTDTLTLEP